MNPPRTPATRRDIFYPESDGQPMADNTEQFNWIVMIKENLETLFHARPDVFVAGDLLWYPVEGRNDIRRAPDVMVVVGRPKGRRGSYRQWEEGNLAPQVVFEVLSPGNSAREMLDKLEFYETYGVDEYYVYDPDTNGLTGWQRQRQRLQAIGRMAGWVSPWLGIRFVPTAETLHLYRPDGHPFVRLSESEQQRVQAEQQRVQAEQQRVQAEARATRAEQRAEQLAARLRVLGLDPDALDALDADDT